MDIQKIHWTKKKFHSTHESCETIALDASLDRVCSTNYLVAGVNNLKVRILKWKMSHYSDLHSVRIVYDKWFMCPALWSSRFVFRQHFIFSFFFFSFHVRTLIMAATHEIYSTNPFRRAHTWKWFYGVENSIIGFHSIKGIFALYGRRSSWVNGFCIICFLFAIESLPIVFGWFCRATLAWWTVWAAHVF